MNHDFFENLIEYSPDLISVINEEGICIYVNQMYEQGLGYKKEMILGKHFAEVVQFTEESLALCLHIFPLVMNGLETDILQVQIYAASGELHTYDIKYQLVSKGPYLQVVLRDVTEQQALREEKMALIERNKLLAETLDHTGIGIIITDPALPDNPIIYANKGFELLTGYEEASIIGKNCRFLKGELTDPLTVEKIRIGIRSNVEVKVDILNYRKNHTTFWNELTINPVFTNTGEVSHYIGVQKDVTARKLHELDLERDLTLSKNLQQHVLSSPYEDEQFRIKGFYQPSYELGGDFYQWKKIGDHLYIVLIIDVMGHGIASSLLTMSLNAEISSLLRRGIHHPASLLTKLNQHMFDLFVKDKETGGVHAYFTCICLLIDTKKERIQYVNAGHPNFLLKGQAGHSLSIPSNEIPVGMIRGHQFQAEELPFTRPCHLFLYTDGLMEYFHCRMREMEAKMTEQIVEELQNRTLVCQASDDLCLIHAEVKEEG